MAIIRNLTKRENYMIVSKIFLQDENLKLSERGLLATLHSLPDEWTFSIKGMSKILPDGEESIRTALNGLIAKGYVTKKQSRINKGHFAQNVLEINEIKRP